MKKGLRWVWIFRAGQVCLELFMPKGLMDLKSSLEHLT